MNQLIEKYQTIIIEGEKRKSEYWYIGDKLVEAEYNSNPQFMY